MEHKSDDFFRKKIEGVEDKLPENSTFDEQLFWGDLQKNLGKPKEKSRWKWIAVAACMGGLLLWAISLTKEVHKIPETNRVQTVEPPIEKSIPVATLVIPQKAKIKVYKSKKKEEAQTKKDLKIEVEPLALKINPIHTQVIAIKKDSINIKPMVVAEIKPQFKIIHVNEISNTEKTPLPQPKFKIRFAARNQP